MKKHENLNCISENREPQRAYYVPQGGCTMLNGIWDFKFFDCDFEEAYIEKSWNKIDVPSCWQLRGYENHQALKTPYYTIEKAQTKLDLQKKQLLDQIELRLEKETSRLGKKRGNP